MSKIKGAQEFELDQSLELEETPTLLEQADSIEPPKSTPRPWLKWLGFSVLLLLATETIITLIDAWQRGPWLFALYGAAFGGAMVALFALVIREWRHLRQLKRREQLSTDLSDIAQSQQIGGLEPHLSQLRTTLPQSTEADWRTFESRSQPHHSDSERLHLLEVEVLAPLDQQAQRIIDKYSAQAALMLAASPLASLDMALMLWRNQRMVEELSRLYGVEPGYLGRVSLVRAMVRNLIYAGGSELMLDLGGQMLSVELSGKLSARVAQGLGAGLLTARLGYQALALTRPVAPSSPKPKLLTLQKRLLGELGQWSAQALKSQLKSGDLNKRL